jgi:3-oxoacyl-[acyl-carrier-protein] synthase-3
MHEELVPTIIGFGYKVPDAIRRNDDPIFAYLNELKDYLERSSSARPAMTAEAELEVTSLVSGTSKSPFYGYETRHVLGRFEKLVDIMKPAAEEALETAKVEPKDIDLLLGCASVSEYIVPSDLYELHKELGLPTSTLAVPFANDFSNFSVALLHADALIRTGHAHTILIAIGGNWSRAVDYHTLQAYSAGDGAAAVVVGRRPAIERWQTWTVVDKEVLANSGNFGTMYLSDVLNTEPTKCRQRCLPFNKSRPLPLMPTSSLCSTPCFHITPAGAKQFHDFGQDRAWIPAVNLLQRKGIPSDQITLIGHQASDALSDAWEKKIRPGYFFKTTKYYANMTVANLPVNLALALSPFKTQERDTMDLEEVSTPYVVLLALGPDMHAHALLLGRAGASA